MAEENEINKEESAASLTRDSSKQVGGKNIHLNRIKNLMM